MIYDLAKDPRALLLLNGAGVLTENMMSITQGFQQVSGAEWSTNRKAGSTLRAEGGTGQHADMHTHTRQQHCFAGEHRMGFIELFRAGRPNPKDHQAFKQGAEISHTMRLVGMAFIVLYLDQKAPLFTRALARRQTWVPDTECVAS